MSVATNKSQATSSEQQDEDELLALPKENEGTASSSSRKRTSVSLYNNEKALEEAPSSLIASSSFSTPPHQQQLGGLKLLKYHCDVCHKDFSNCVRIKCAVCEDFDTCVDCFSVGSERGEHKSNHRYYTMEPLSATRLLSPDWTADEDWALLEGIEKYGLGNWQEIAEHIAPITRWTKTKTKEKCESHYMEHYLNSPEQDSEVLNRMRKQNSVKPVASSTNEDNKSNPDEDSDSLSAKTATRIKTEDNASDTAASGAGGRLGPPTTSPKTTKPPPAPPSRHSHAGGAGDSHIIGFMPKREDFDVEYDNDAELIIADMEFTDDLNEEQKEVQLKVLEAYNHKLDERERRKRFLIERGLLDLRRLQQNEKKKTKDERDIYNHLRPLMRFHSQEDHEQLISNLIEERKLRIRLEKLLEWRSLGLNTQEETQAYELERRKRHELKNDVIYIYGEHGNARQARKAKVAHMRGDRVSGGPIPAAPLMNHDRLPCAELLNEKEKELCEKMQIPPQHYLVIKKVLTEEALRIGFITKDDCSQLLRIEKERASKLYDFFVDAKWIPSTVSAEQKAIDQVERATASIASVLIDRQEPQQQPSGPRRQSSGGSDPSVSEKIEEASAFADASVESDGVHSKQSETKSSIAETKTRKSKTRSRGHATVEGEAPT